MPSDLPSADISIDPDDLDNNPSDNPHLRDLMGAQLQRRHVLKGGVGALTLASFGALGMTACGGSDDDEPAPQGAQQLGFNAVSKGLADQIVVASGYTATVIYATGDPLTTATPDYADNGSNANFSQRAGDHHDGIHYFGLNAAGDRDGTSTTRGLLTMNHENIAGTVTFMHPAGQTNASSGARPEAEALKEIEAHGVSVVEIAKAAGGAFATVRGSAFNRRVTAGSLVQLSGPARGSDFVKTKYSPNGLITRGTINNCGAGITPWGTYLTAEENWAGYFRRDAGDAAQRDAKGNAALLRNGIRPGQAGNNRWTSVVPADTTSTEFSRWDCSVDPTQPADGSGDFRNVQNTYGYVVEIDPYDPLSTPRKRTAMGRRANEGATCSVPVAGKPLAFYIGCDSRGEYLYKFVTKAPWDAADANRGGLTVGNKYLDEGTIYAARCNADGTGTWLKLDLSNPAVAAGVPVSAQNPAGYTFANLADICVNTRLAADAAGATRMDRPEWTAVNPFNGEVYITMTENPDRGSTATVSGNNFPNPDVDPANPRYWLDTRTDNANQQKGNVHGHVLRLREDGDSADATSFRWDVFLFAAQAVADTGQDNANYQQNVNLSGLSELNDLSKPDGCWFSKSTGVLWIETDDNTMTDRTNCMLLAAVPGRYGDGGAVTVVNKPNGSPNAAVTTDKPVATYAGRRMTDATLKRFLVAPKGAEITGVTESPDGRTLFVNIQHPGENTAAANVGNPAAYESHWPGNGGGIAAAYGPGGATARPRSATVMITRNDGGQIGV